MQHRRSAAGRAGLALGLLLAGAAQAAPGPDRSDVAYGPDPRQKLDLCRPAGGDPGGAAIAVVMIHGGGWNGGRKEDYRGMCRLFADRGGFVVAAIEYRFADGSAQGAWPAFMEDAQLALRWMRVHARDYGADPGRICALGDSAGGHIAALLAATRMVIPGDMAGELPGVSPAVACAVDEFGPADFTVASPFQNALARFFPGLDEAGRRARAREVSPLFAIGPDTAPVFVTHGFDDKAAPIGQSFALVAALQRAGVRAEFMAFDGGHEFVGQSPAAKAALLELEMDFVRRTGGLGPSR